MEALRDSDTGETKVLDENFFLEIALHRTVLGEMTETDAEAYRSPYPSRESRRPLLEWPRSFPIEGTPGDVNARVAAYSDWLAESTDVPKLLLTFSGPAELLMIGPDEVTWSRSNIANLEVEQCGPAGHLAPEDQPAAIAAAITTLRAALIVKLLLDAELSAVIKPTLPDCQPVEPVLMVTLAPDNC